MLIPPSHPPRVAHEAADLVYFLNAWMSLPYTEDLLAASNDLLALLTATAADVRGGEALRAQQCAQW